jgi:outer membrane receptor protein involved in Fe transport
MISPHSTNKKSLGVRVRKSLQLLVCVLGVLLLSVPAFSQGSTGRILGTVTDQSGGVISGATVTVLDKDRGVSRTLTTDDAGAYNAPNLTPGNYTVRAESKGFKVFERQSISLDVGKEVRIDATLQPGDQTQTITITEAVPLVETTNATMGGTLENADIADLPLNGRDYQNLLGLRPGVMLQPGGGPWTQSTNGVRPDESVWMVDGVINSNFFDNRPIGGMPSPFMDSAIILPIDAIQEFNLMENPKAEYGWKPGAVVNVGIKSGTNELHGSLYAFGRVDSWDARNYFNVGPTGGSCLLGGGSPLSVCNKVPVQLKQFGGVVGGKIKKDKLFYFAGYEGARSSIGSDLVAGVPSNAPGGGTASSMPDAIAALVAAGIPVSQVSLNTMGCVVVPAIACTAGSNGYGTGPAGKAGLLPFNGTNTFLSTFPNVNQSDNGIGKIDYHPNDKNAIFGTFISGRYDSVGEDHPFVNTNFTDTAPIKVYSNVESWVYTPNSTLVNELRFGYDRTDFNFVNLDINSLANGTGQYNFINTGSTVGGFPNVVINGFGPGQTLGTAANRPQFNSPNPYYDFQDSISVLKGRHSFKFGGEYTKIEADSSIGASARGNFSFTGGICAPTAVEDFFAGCPASGLLLAGSPLVQAHWSSYAGYVQDDWRATPKLIINLGLRYEYASPMKAAGANFGSFDPNVGMIQQGSIGHPALWKGDRTGFEPRVGFAWDVNGKGTTVVRAGGSLIHTLFPLLTFDGEFGLENDTSTSLAAVPTGAAFQCVGLPGQSPCPANGGGSIGLAVNTFLPPSLCWDPAVPNTSPAFSKACTNGQKTIFPVTSAQCGDGVSNAAQLSGFDANPCDIMGVDPNLRSPLVINYNLSVTHTFGSNLSIEVGYVGNRGQRLLNFRDINQSPLGAGWCLNTLTPAQAVDACKAGTVDNKPTANGNYNAIATQEARPFYSKFPYLGFINFATNAAHSRYDGAQVSVTKRMSHGLSFNAGYTYSHALDNGSLNRFGGLPQDSQNVAAEYASSDFDVRHRLTFTGTYDIPGIKGFAQLLEGWEINTIVNYQTAQPWTAADGIQPGPAGDRISGTGEGADRWNISGSPSNFPSGKDSVPYCSGFSATGSASAASCVITTVYGNIPAPSTVNPASCTSLVGTLTTGPNLNAFGCYVSLNNQSVLAPPPLGSFGNMGRNIFRDSGFKDWDMSLFKNFTFKERYRVQFRIEGFNILNHPVAANPYGASSFVNSGNALSGGGPLGFAGLTPDFAAGNPLVGSGSNRAVQLGLKIGF